MNIRSGFITLFRSITDILYKQIDTNKYIFVFPFCLLNAECLMLVPLGHGRLSSSFLLLCACRCTRMFTNGRYNITHTHSQKRIHQPSPTEHVYLLASIQYTFSPSLNLLSSSPWRPSSLPLPLLLPPRQGGHCCRHVVQMAAVPIRLCCSRAQKRQEASQ